MTDLIPFKIELECNRQAAKERHDRLGRVIKHLYVELEVVESEERKIEDEFKKMYQGVRKV